MPNFGSIWLISLQQIEYEINHALHSNELSENYTLIPTTIFIALHSCLFVQIYAERQDLHKGSKAKCKTNKSVRQSAKQTREGKYAEYFNIGKIPNTNKAVRQNGRIYQLEVYQYMFSNRIDILSKSILTKIAISAVFYRYLFNKSILKKTTLCIKTSSKRDTH